jgi:hypothetical protein
MQPASIGNVYMLPNMDVSRIRKNDVAPTTKVLPTTSQEKTAQKAPKSKNDHVVRQDRA